ncbi:MAG: hypothetical protein IJ877_00960 [Candidatus Gastranaerophilales bacterium]|nr:hypothetical protein [Candidatus Gastranaerophilales bacterium]
MKINFDNFFKKVGYLASIVTILAFFVTCYTIFYHPIQKLGFICHETEIIKDPEILIFKERDTQTWSYRLFVNETYQDFSKNWITREKNIKNLYAYKIQIKNTGKKDIRYSDFYEADRLSLNLHEPVVAISIGAETPKYINVKIKNFKMNSAEINFDTIKPNDSIYLTVISLGKFYSSDNIVSGKTKEIDNIKALDYQTADLFYNSSEYWNRELMYIKEGCNLIKKSSITNLIGFILSMILIFYATYFCTSKKQKKD